MTRPQTVTRTKPDRLTLSRYPLLYQKSHAASMRIFFCVLAVGAFLCVWAFDRSVRGDLPLGGFVFVATIWLWLLLGFLEKWRSWAKVSVMCYLDKRVCESPDFTSGQVIARNMVFLDRLARDGDTHPLSDYGYNDDLLRQTVIWYEAASGIKTLDVLQRALAVYDSPDAPGLVERELLRDALAKFRDYLVSAEAKQAKFALILHQDCFSVQEQRVRKGFLY